MSASEKQIAANRKNAKRSTGPKTESGKQKASRNATTHGAFAQDLIIRSPYLEEDPDEYDRLLVSLNDELKPDTYFQECLVRKIANCLWRSRRIVAAETAHIVKELDSVPYDLCDIQTTAEISATITGSTHPKPTSEEIEEKYHTLAIARSVPDMDTSRHLLYYEMRLDRQLTRAYKLFKELRRSTQLVPAEIIPDPLPAKPEMAEPEPEHTDILPKTNPIIACPPTT